MVITTMVITATMVITTVVITTMVITTVVIITMVITTTITIRRISVVCSWFVDRFVGTFAMLRAVITRRVSCSFSAVLSRTGHCF